MRLGHKFSDWPSMHKATIYFAFAPIGCRVSRFLCSVPLALLWNKCQQMKIQVQISWVWQLLQRYTQIGQREIGLASLLHSRPLSLVVFTFWKKSIQKYKVNGKSTKPCPWIKFCRQYKTTHDRWVIRQQNVADIIEEATWRSKQFQVKKMLSHLKIRSGCSNFLIFFQIHNLESFHG